MKRFFFISLFFLQPSLSFSSNSYRSQEEEQEYFDSLSKPCFDITPLMKQGRTVTRAFFAAHPNYNALTVVTLNGATVRVYKALSAPSWIALRAELTGKK